MKRQRVEVADLAERGNLALALWKAARGKRHRPAVAAFLADADERLALLARRILAGEAPLGLSQRFVIHDPKRREITAACFEDRVLHHAILNLAEPRFERALADSVYACRPGKGVHAAVMAVQRGLQRWPWVVQVDVAGYFAAIRHDVLMAQLSRLFKGADFLALLRRILVAGDIGPRRNALAPFGDGSHRPALEGMGLPIGALTSQHFANHHLVVADRLLLEHPGVRAHVRYMDDVVWCCDSLGAAHDSLAALRACLQEGLGLQLKPGAQPMPSRRGLRFCGYRIKPGVVLAGPRKMRRARAQKARLEGAEGHGWPQPLLQRAHASQVAALLPAQSQRFLRALWCSDTISVADGLCEAGDLS